MNPTQTGIAVALALAVVVSSFMFGFPSFSSTQQPAAAGETQSLQDVSQGQQTTSTSTMSATQQPIQEITQLMMKDEVVGTGAEAAPGDMVTVNYVGQLTNGTEFDASAKHGTEGFTFPLGAGRVIKGWDQGIVGMKEGGVRMLAIPASLAYGNQAIGNVIPANSPLIFRVELLKVQKAAK